MTSMDPILERGEPDLIISVEISGLLLSYGCIDTLALGSGNSDRDHLAPVH